jgi:hypothetical protein
MLLAVVAVACGAALALGAGEAHALCTAVPEEGVWANADPASSGISRIELRSCQPITTCSGGICTTQYDAGWTMHVFGRCSPTDCDWGTVTARRLSSGHVFGTYNQGFATRYVWAKMSQFRPGQLWVYWKTDFADPARADYDKQEWFVKIGS